MTSQVRTVTEGSVPVPGRVRTPAELTARLGEPFPPTDEQAAVVTAPLVPQVVVAGAGSGKTQTMGLRVLWLVATGAVEPHRVLGLTFTRKAAAELGERVRRMLRRLLLAHERDPFLAEDVAVALRTGEPLVTTYHSYAATLVAEHALRVGREPDSRLIGEALSWQLAAQVVESYDGPMEAVDRVLTTVVGDVLALAGELSEHLREVDEVSAVDEQLRATLTGLPPARSKSGKASPMPAPVREVLDCLAARQALLPLVSRYVAAKAQRGVLDYGDQVALAARVARADPEVAAIERSRYGAVLLDEYQDTGEAQRVLLTELFGGGHPVTAVGDPRQSIYGWRGASAGNLERFPDDFAVGPKPGRGRQPAVRLRGLTTSFRNGERILAVANRLAADIPMRALPDGLLQPGPGRGGAGHVVAALHETVHDEARWIAEQVSLAGAAGRAWGKVAVLARKRSQLTRIEAALRERDVPCEVVGLGGLLLEPEVVDVVATLRVLADPTAGSALVRLLTGPRWRIGPRDLAALGRRARALAAPRSPSAATRPSSDGGGAAPLPDAAGAPPDLDVTDERSLVDALEDPGPGTAYSAAGFPRLLRLRDELRRLRRHTSGSLPELVLAVVQAMGLDVELAARPGVRPGDALLNVDRLVEVTEEFVASGEDPGLVAFLAYLDTAEERERGLEVEEPESDVDRVQLMTVHAAKGLEWDVVFVAGLTRKVFPVEGQPVPDWTRALATLPFPLRGDHRELPVLDCASVTDQGQARMAIEQFRAACRDRATVEERRLAYVAVTRARDLLGCSGYWWDDSKQARGPSEFLCEIAAVCRDGAGSIAAWCAAPAEGVANPTTQQPVTAAWPVDPLGARRPALEAAADNVRRARRRLARGEHTDVQVPESHQPRTETGRRWREERLLLLAELDRSRRSGPIPVELPQSLSVSQLVTLARSPAQLARQLRRPLPAPPAPHARRGTRFHLWLEHRWGQQRLLDVDELPGAADETAHEDENLVALQEAFRASAWWDRVPAEVEFPFDLVVDGVLLRGRCDAVFDDAPDGLVDVVDWKTGRPPTSAADRAAAAVQLAAYRLAWHHLSGTPLDRIRAAFHYVAANETVRPADLLDEEGLRDLVRSVPAARGGGERG